MIIIKHRVNSISQIKKTPEKYGVEIDLRSDKKSIYLQHDPFMKGVKFQKWIKYYKHNLLVLNVKEEGLENNIIKILKKNKIKNFFFHDQTFSSLLKNKKKTKTSIRHSEFEEIKEKKYIFKYIKWLWIDHFTKFSLDTSFYNFLKRNKVKICIVSPELVNIKHTFKIKNLINKIVKKKIKINAVCTKKPHLWEKYIKD
jgi:hypothetical protein